ncbi:hypothetical protein PybrP1_000841 [[Pythium] brassicae (nom. inval.)]|nr:hypothetical protein PybrP1_000841 [[Pythium] brassicae (nom. inval.)]
MQSTCITRPYESTVQCLHVVTTSRAARGEALDGAVVVDVGTCDARALAVAPRLERTRALVGVHVRLVPRVASQPPSVLLDRAVRVPARIWFGVTTWKPTYTSTIELKSAEDVAESSSDSPGRSTTSRAVASAQATLDPTTRILAAFACTEQQPEQLVYVNGSGSPPYSAPTRPDPEPHSGAPTSFATTGMSNPDTGTVTRYRDCCDRPNQGRPGDESGTVRVLDDVAPRHRGERVDEVALDQRLARADAHDRRRLGDAASDVVDLVERDVGVARVQQVAPHGLPERVALDSAPREQRDPARADERHVVVHELHAVALARDQDRVAADLLERAVLDNDVLDCFEKHRGDARHRPR